MNYTLQQLDNKYNTMVNDLDKLFKVIELNEVKLIVVSNGKIFRWIQPKEPDTYVDNKLTFKLGIPYWKYVEDNKLNNIIIKDKMISKAKVIANAFLIMILIIKKRVLLILMGINVIIELKTLKKYITIKSNGFKRM